MTNRYKGIWAHRNQMDIKALNQAQSQLFPQKPKRLSVNNSIYDALNIFSWKKL